MKLSIVATLYKSEQYIQEFCHRASIAAKQVAGDDFEIILVNDGSPDASLKISVSLIEKFPSLIVVDLSRNFGHHKAMMTGLGYAKGEKVFLLDSDLEEEPEWLISFSEQMQTEHCDVVYGVQKKRKGNFFERYSGKLFYFLLNSLTKERLPANITVARLMTRRYVNALIRHQEHEIYIAGLWHITGFQQHAQIVKKHSSSKTTYTLGRKISLLVNSITSFSNLPLVAVFYFGLLLTVFACSYTMFLIISKFFYHKILDGWTSVMASIWLLGGAIISSIGVIGIYLSKMFIEIKRRPYTIIRDVYRLENTNKSQKLIKQDG
ncbi:glycosyltransferase family 2 protein [Legionella oakridgensis]|uniref:Glycosyltransferase involved in cell wall biogenesis n=2 Tax=Legionella oakridgensis TaxID=29423 RepID=W0BG68_9GAMM|nr:glycosyltransferase family 2 protein [Legionella oakridgensis]AHE67622.1 glycosyltransferase involved in cell wall biogenesis [Legionella oakridgensis ATCC 33761 = DSM 21215]ETO92859.1 glycosyltransferase involved in cell wall biogenesis [Legionella oakridgensis RV-2-2007]KTD37034.1 glycosyltransferase, group 2 family protein (glycan biosynthesis) [Legionella oakridgensis]STY20657.1 glycosyltransferase, group 2 family protein (glycan biosynthesis) [Legionella longbeachae]